MNIGNITSNNMNLTENGRFMQIELYEKEIERLNNIINELEEYIKPFLYMLNGITDRDIYEECQLDDFTMIMKKLQELKGSNDNE